MNDFEKIDAAITEFFSGLGCVGIIWLLIWLILCA